MKISELAKRYDDFELRIGPTAFRRGEIVGVIGANGSGKTTALKLMAGLIAPDRGCVDWEGLTARDVTYAPQKPYLLRDTVLANLRYPLALRGVRDAGDRVARALELAGLRGYEKRPARGLSGGERQKLSLARAMVFSPRAIFLDEAFSSMDVEGALGFERAFADYCRAEGAIGVVVSHSLSRIRRLCGRCVFLHRGEVLADGDASELMSRPSEPTLEAFLAYER